ncbi:hypothetical protein [Myroides odoratimimus]|uniref:hypothetical protein n=1 Tax=Myroides odoratimimus TaxID=76832 RepID=UPI002575F53E|nr:hypothetical protein [Myroides odoratimimus]MDM1513590.1 hypothetical protein [Myroides odoratimimus]
MSKNLYQTSDGTKFYQEQDAKNHALSLEDRKVIEVNSEQLTVDSVDKEQENKKPKSDKKTAPELISEIEQVETLEQLAAYEVHKQVTVKNAVEKRRAELIAAIEVDSEKVETGNGEPKTEKGELETGNGESETEDKDE